MASEEDRQTKPASLRKLILNVLSDVDVDWHRLLFESVSSKGMHLWMADRQWLLPGVKCALVDPNSSSLPAVIAEELKVFLRRMSERGCQCRTDHNTSTGGPQECGMRDFALATTSTEKFCCAKRYWSWDSSQQIDRKVSHF